jgi:glycosyltransferase involved in cell wall biosynthesis
LAQTYADYELIIIDDGSTDGSAEIAEAILQDPASRLIASSPHRLIRQANFGVSAARNNGVAASSGDYIAFLDADDWWEPTFLEKMVQLIEDYPAAGLYASNYMYYKPGKTRVAVNNIETGYFNYPKSYYEGGAMPVTSISVVIPHKLLDEVGGFPLGIKLGEDFLLWAKIAMQYKVAFLNEPLAWYNNDVPATLRATRNLHKPEHHMLFNMKELIGESLKIKGEEISGADTNAYNLSLITYKPTNDDWRRLLDKLRVNGLLDYWLNKRYHDQAAEELKKVDWTKQPASVKRMYKTPIWILKVKRLIMSCGSFVKQRFVKLLKKN